MRCLVLAGGTPRPAEPLYAETAGGPKAMLELAGRPMVQWVLDALAASGEIDHVVLVGDLAADLVFSRGPLDRIAGRGSLAANLFAGIDRLLESDTGADRAVFCWSDIPLATGPMVARFLADARAAGGADVVAGLVRRRDLARRWPEIREPWLRLREGRFVAADLGVFDPRQAERVRRPLEVLTGQRKSALRQARTVGLGLLLRYLLGRLTLPDLERTLARRYGIAARVLISADPELGLDVDGPANLAICRRELESARGGRGGGGSGAPPQDPGGERPGEHR